jgi:hypothetical protein
MGPMNDVERSHYIPRTLLRNWETKAGDLKYYEFSTARVRKSSAKAIYVSRVAFDRDVERWLGRVIETPMGEYIARTKKTLATGAKDPPMPTSREWRALILALITQFGRTSAADSDGKDRDLTDLSGRPDSDMDQLVETCRTENDLVVGYSPHERLYFPEHGFVPLMVLGSEHACLLPLTPTLFIAMVGRDARPDAIDELLKQKLIISGLSVGLSGDRVILPPFPSGVDLAPVGDWVRELRGLVTDLCRTHWRTNRLRGRRDSLLAQVEEQQPITLTYATVPAIAEDEE